MVDVFPFEAVLYDPRAVKDIKQVVTPPYDVITPEQQEFYYDLNDYNVIRLDLGKEYAEDRPSNNRYTRAAAFFNDWRTRGILKQDEAPALYRYEISYTLPQYEDDGRQSQAVHAAGKTLSGFFASVGVEPYSSGKVLPHEDTFPKVKQDRLSLMRAARANFSPIFTLYSDPENRIEKMLRDGTSQPPPIDFEDADRSRHRLWRIQDPVLIRTIQDLMQPQTLLIADGHHRYDTALAYRKENPLAARMLMYLVSMQNPGLSLLPIHRVIHGLTRDQSNRLSQSLPRYFEVDRTIVSLPELLERMKTGGAHQPTLGAYNDQGKYLLLSLKPKSLENAMTSTKLPPSLTRLDVNLFDQIVIEGLLGLSGGASDRETHLLYIKDPRDGIDKVRRGAAQFAFFLNPTRIETVQDLARSGIKMPHKSTYFFPKPLSGLVIHAFPNET